MNRFAKLASLAFLAPLMFGSAARADIILNFAGATVTTGGRVTIDVTGTGGSLADFSLGFRLTGGTLTTPTFVNPTGAATDPTLTAPGYVFAVGSDDAATGERFGTATPTVPGGPAVNFQGSDLEDGPDAPLGPGRNLLARLIIQAPSFVVSPTGTDFYTLQLATGQTSFDTNGGNTPVALSASSVQQVTISVVGAATAVPEPGSMALVLSGLAATLPLLRRWRP